MLALGLAIEDKDDDQIFETIIRINEYRKKMLYYYGILRYKVAKNLPMVSYRKNSFVCTY